MKLSYDLHSWSKHYREEALWRARERDLLRQARVDRSLRSGRSTADSVRAFTLSLLGRARRTVVDYRQGER